MHDSLGGVAGQPVQLRCEGVLAADAGARPAGHTCSPTSSSPPLWWPAMWPTLWKRAPPGTVSSASSCHVWRPTQR
ncbi:hypothetical protein HaLaN_22559, partial [Haematococcus lacustris]